MFQCAHSIGDWFSARGKEEDETNIYECDTVEHFTFRCSSLTASWVAAILFYRHGNRGREAGWRARGPTSMMGELCWCDLKAGECSWSWYICTWLTLAHILGTEDINCKYPHNTWLTLHDLNCIWLRQVNIPGFHFNREEEYGPCGLLFFFFSPVRSVKNQMTK